MILRFLSVHFGSQFPSRFQVEANRPKPMGMAFGSGNNWMPHYVKPTTSKGGGSMGGGGGGGKGGRGSQSGGQRFRQDQMGQGQDPRGTMMGGQKKIVISVSEKSFNSFCNYLKRNTLTYLIRNENSKHSRLLFQGLSIQEKVELHSAENAWKPSVKGAKAENGGDARDDLAKKARAILNKLTPQKFDTLVGKFDELKIENEDDLGMIIGLVFEKVSQRNRGLVH